MSNRCVSYTPGNKLVIDLWKISATSGHILPKALVRLNVFCPDFMWMNNNGPVEVRPTVHPLTTGIGSSTPVTHIWNKQQQKMNEWNIDMNPIAHHLYRYIKQGSPFRSSRATRAPPRTPGQSTAVRCDAWFPPCCDPPFPHPFITHANPTHSSLCLDPHLLVLNWNNLARGGEKPRTWKNPLSFQTWNRIDKTCPTC